MKLRTEIKQGKKGKWRWSLIDEEGVYRAMCTVKGFDHDYEAVQDLRNVRYAMCKEERREAAKKQALNHGLTAGIVILVLLGLLAYLYLF